MRRLSVALVAAILALALAGPAVQARTTFIPFSCAEHFADNPEPGRVWVDDDFVLHVRGSQWIYEHEGDRYCAGEAHVVVNLNVDLATGEGNLWGTIHVDLDGIDGGWHRTFSAHFTNPHPLMPEATDIWAGRFTGHGFGELDGWQIRGQGIERTHVLVESTGFVFQPGG